MPYNAAGERLRLVAQEMLMETPRVDRPWNATKEMFQNPQIGMRFHEMYAFWVYVARMDPQEGGDTRVIVEEYHPPCTVPVDAKVRMFPTLDAFRKAYAYSGKPERGYSVYYANGAGDVSHWMTPCADALVDTLEEGKRYTFVFEGEDFTLVEKAT
jgi:hypothetical protein